MLVSENHKKIGACVRRRDVLLRTIRLIEGGMSKAAEHLGYTRDALSNRIYERKGQQLSVDDILELQLLSGKTYFAEAIALESGGVFVKLPDAEVCNDELLTKFQEVQVHLGELSRAFIDVTSDGVINKAEKKQMDTIAGEIHKTIRQLLAITYQIYCPQETSVSRK